MEVLGELPQSCQILFSTQSGRAKACARRCARVVRERTNLQVLNRSGGTFDESVLNLSEWCNALRSSGAFLILFVSTTGDGEHTETIQNTWKLLLQKSVPKDTFKGISFAIFNLGDRAYGPNFCAAGRKLAVRMLQLGAKLFGEAGYGDDGTPNGGCFADLDLWLENVLLKGLGVSDAVSELDSPSIQPQSPYHVAVGETLSTDDASEEQDTREEWRQNRFSQSYRQFFGSRGSISAYQYDASSPGGTSPDDQPPYSSRVLVGIVRENRRLTADDWEQDTRHIQVEVQAPGARSEQQTETTPKHGVLPYGAGDVASVLPSNSQQEVQRFLNVLPAAIRNVADHELNIEYDGSVEATAGVGYPFWPQKCTLRGWLTFCADIHALPEREDLRALSNFCSTDHPNGKDQKEKLRSLSETSESALYVDYILREKRSWADVLYDFDAIRSDDSTLTVEFLLALLSPIRPRDFSIASAPTERLVCAKSHDTPSGSPSPFTIELCVAVVRGTTPLGRTYHGLCSQYLADQVADESAQGENPLLRLWIRPGSFRGLPLETNVSGRMEKPVLCIGAGTGIAPLRGLLREREAVRRLSSNISESLDVDLESDRDNVLVFGCRKESSDFYYKTDWEEFVCCGALTLLTAFSRDQWHKIYVQQVLEKAEKDHKLITRHLLQKEGSVYIAGGPQMARAVKEVITESLVAELKGEEKQALVFLSRLQRQGKLAIEAWG